MSAPHRFEAFADRAAAQPPGVIAYLTAGDGGCAKTVAAMHGIEAGGARAIELGVPHSDPVADGPVLQAAAARVLRAGFRTGDLVTCLEQYRAEGGRLPIVLFGYANVLAERATNEFYRGLAEAGADALAIPDLPREEAADVIANSEAVGLRMVFFVAPNTIESRLAAAAEASTAFLYAVARRGTTGSDTEFDAELESYLGRVRRVAGSTPVAVGFGFSRAEQVRALQGRADHAVVGTALVRALEGVPASEAGTVARNFLQSLGSQAPFPTTR